jgi:hypothetical protein
MELQDEIKAVLKTEATKKQWRDNHASPEFKAAEALGKKVNSPLNRSRNCSCIEDLFIVLKILTRNNNKLKSLEMNKTHKFRLKENQVLQLFGRDPLTNDNLTDEIAIALIQENSKNIANFEHYPENWESLCKIKSSKAPAAKTSEEPKADASEDAKTAEDADASNAAEDAGNAPEEAEDRESELMKAGKENPEVLRQLADALFESGKAPKKAHNRAGVPKLVKYILDNE